MVGLLKNETSLSRLNHKYCEGRAGASIQGPKIASHFVSALHSVHTPLSNKINEFILVMN